MLSPSYTPEQSGHRQTKITVSSRVIMPTPPFLVPSDTKLTRGGAAAKEITVKGALRSSRTLRAVLSAPAVNRAGTGVYSYMQRSNCGATREEGAPHERDQAGVPRVRRRVLRARGPTQGRGPRGGRGTVPHLRLLSHGTLRLRPRHPDREPVRAG